MDWPHTRTTCPVTALDAGLANHATVSATSTVSPPCCSELIRRPASRVATGIAAVMAVSMKPGATALTVIFLSASASLVAWTRPMTPAFEAP